MPLPIESGALEMIGGMTRKELIFSALAYRRHTGASLGEIRAFASVREAVTGSQKEDRGILLQLEREGVVNKIGNRFLTSLPVEGPTANR
jgi:hypothetical protein